MTWSDEEHHGAGRDCPTVELKIVSMYRGGKSVRACAAAYGLSYTTTHKILDRHDVLRRKQGGGRRRLPIPSEFAQDYDRYRDRLNATDFTQTTKDVNLARVGAFLRWAENNFPDVLSMQAKFETSAAVFAGEKPLNYQKHVIASLRDFGRRIALIPAGRDVQ